MIIISCEMSEIPTPEDSIGDLCANCPAACCRDMIIHLRRNEVKDLRKAGTKFGISLQTLLSNMIDSVPNSRAYAMKGPCGNLRAEAGVEYCGDYPNRPEACRNFKMGGRACDVLRLKKHNNKKHTSNR